MSDRAYDHDALAWAEHQAGLLRRLAAGERLNEAVDWPNVIEEVQDVGLSELRACESLLRQALLHLLKIQAWPGSRSVGHWRSEAIAFLTDAHKRYTPSMRQRIDLEELYGTALAQVHALDDDSDPAHVLASLCPYGLEELLTKRPDMVALGERLAAGAVKPA